MWNRFRRAMRSFVGFFISSIEDPELILEQNIRDLNDQVPKMNESIAMVRANVTLLEKENTKYRAEVSDMTAKVKAAISAGRDDLAGQYATRLQAEKLQAQELVKQFKMEMGLQSPAPVSDVSSGGEKTIGKKEQVK